MSAVEFGTWWIGFNLFALYLYYLNALNTRDKR